MSGNLSAMSSEPPSPVVSEERPSPPTGGQPRDPLEGLLTSLDVRVHAFALCKVAPGYRLVVPASETVLIHYVLEGEGVVACAGSPPAPFVAGSLVLAPPGREKSIAISAGPGIDVNVAECCNLLAEGLMTFQAGEGDGQLVAACGTLTATYAGGYGLFDHLTEPLVARADGDSVLRAAFDLMLAEVRAPGFGTRAMTEACMKQCLLLLLRDRVKRSQSEVDPLLVGLRDPRLLRVVSAVVSEPATQHTLENLAAVAGMSRSVFVKRFSEAFRQTPFEFVLKVRLRHAAHLLSVTPLPVKVIARSAGFSSRSHFSRAFSTAYGCDPTSWREAAGHWSHGSAPPPPAPAPRIATNGGARDARR